MSEVQHRVVETNGIRLHVAEQGEGPLVLLCHGFPESWYSWRHQLRALAEAGFHAVAPDMRGYGQSEAPAEIERYTLLHLVGDMVGLLDALGAPTAVIAGHDWGAPVAWHAALLRPDRFRAVIGLSVPFRPRGSTRPTTQMPQTADTVFYQLYFQEPGVAEAELERDVRTTIRRILYSGSGDRSESSDGGRARAGLGNPEAVGMVPRRGGFLSHTADAEVLPLWLTEADVDFFAGEFSRAGFRGGLNWYRNLHRNWELMAPFAAAPIRQPSLFVAGSRDGVIRMPGMRTAMDELRPVLPGLTKSVIIDGVGHWVQQEAPDEVNALLLDFLTAL
jgi:pimeloyl-ACP methyl ester carboxylesterase